MVVDGGASLRTALLGDLMAGPARENGWAGVVIHGAVRNSAVLAGIGLGVQALGTNPRKSAKAGRGRGRRTRDVRRGHLQPRRHPARRPGRGRTAAEVLTGGQCTPA
ncbi:hypothetical protein OG787_31875 [Streptomyces sp. NBC_00075]